MNCDASSSLPDWLIEHPESAEVFDELGLDTSCGGRSLEFLCVQQSLDVRFVLLRLQQLIEPSSLPPE